MKDLRIEILHPYLDLCQLGLGFATSLPGLLDPGLDGAPPIPEVLAQRLPQEIDDGNDDQEQVEPASGGGPPAPISPASGGQDGFRRNEQDDQNEEQPASRLHCL